MSEYAWVIPFLVWWFLGFMAAIAGIAWFAERNPMGISAKIVKALTPKKEPEPDLEIRSPEVLFNQPNGTIIEDGKGLVLERFEGRWINSRGRVQARIALPAHIIPDRR